MLKIFCIKDDKAGVFLKPFFAAHAGDALRQVTVVLRDKNSLLASFPGDYSVWEMGLFMEESGEFRVPGPEFLSNVVSLQGPGPQEPGPAQ